MSRFAKNILSLAPPSAHDIELLFFEHLHQRRNIRRIVLAIAIGGDDESAARVREPGRKRGGLSEIAAKANDAEPRVCVLEGLEH
jgi:hypothetical protein